MEIGIQEYKELKRIGLENYKETKETKKCRNIRELEYTIYFYEHRKIRIQN